MMEGRMAAALSPPSSVPGVRLITGAGANIATHCRGKPWQGDRAMELRDRVSLNPGVTT